MWGATLLTRANKTIVDTKLNIHGFDHQKILRSYGIYCTFIQQKFWECYVILWYPWKLSRIFGKFFAVYKTVLDDSLGICCRKGLQEIYLLLVPLRIYNLKWWWWIYFEKSINECIKSSNIQSKSHLLKDVPWMWIVWREQKNSNKTFWCSNLIIELFWAWQSHLIQFILLNGSGSFE